jgi:hypothetical protein
MDVYFLVIFLLASWLAFARQDPVELLDKFCGLFYEGRRQAPPFYKLSVLTKELSLLFYKFCSFSV